MIRSYLCILSLIFCLSCKSKPETNVQFKEIQKKPVYIDIGKNKETSTTNQKTNDSIYKWFKPEALSSLDRRTVRAESGLNIRDSLGNKIGKLVFGEVVYILEYSKDIKEVKDNGNTIKGRTVKIITKWSNESIKMSENSYKHNWYVLKEDVGYVFEGFLYENNRDGYEDSLYNYGYLVLGEKGEDSKIDLKKLLEIKNVDYKKYENRIIQLPEIITIEAPKKVDGKISLDFKNGKNLTLKDTTYNSEYNPTKSYGVFYHRSFPENYMVTENMFFMSEIHTELNIKTGDTLNRFNGYPHISPDKNYAVLVTHDLTECYHDTYFEVHKKGLNGTYKRMLSFNPISWSYPFKKNNQSSMDDIFTISWINKNEFIINAVNYIDDCYDPEQLSKPYYLKFKIKI